MSKAGAKKTAGVEPPFQLSGDKSPTFSSSFEGVAQLLHGRKNIIVLVGAGISVSW